MSLFSQKDDQFSGLWGSLASRVMVVAMCFLVVPLFIHGVISYMTDYKDDFQDLFLSLKVLGKSRATLLDQFNHLEYRFLDLTEELLSLKIAEPNISDDQINGFLAKLKRQQNVSAIFYLDKGDGEWECTRSSNPAMLGKSYASAIDPLSLSLDHAATIRWDPSTRQGYYVISKRVYAPGSVRIVGMLNIALSNKSMLERISIIKKKQDPSQVVLLDKHGRIFLSTNPDLVFSRVEIEGEEEDVKGPPPKSILTLKPLDVDVIGAANNYEFLINGKKQDGVLMDVSSSDIRILVYVPAHNFQVHFIQTMYEVGIFLVAVIIIGGIGTWWLTHSMARPFKTLCMAMHRVEAGDLQARFEEQRMGFEINIVGGIFNRMIDSLIRHMHTAENERVARETLAKELYIGQEVQKSILPKTVPAFSDLDISSGYIAAKEVGGDFYDLFTVQREKDHHLMCAVADTAGKGISACFYSLGLRSMLRSYVATEENLGDALVQTNNVFCEDTADSGVFVTAWVAYIDEQSKKMSYSSCGHPPTLIKKKDGTVEKLTTPGIALGATHLDEVSTHDYQLETGDVLMMYSDGITEAHNDKKELFGETRLEQFFKDHDCEYSQKLIDDLLIEVGKFTTGVAQFDDMTLLVIRVM